MSSKEDYDCPGANKTIAQSIIIGVVFACCVVAYGLYLFGLKNGAHTKEKELDKQSTQPVANDSKMIQTLGTVAVTFYFSCAVCLFIAGISDNYGDCKSTTQYLVTYSGIPLYSLGLSTLLVLFSFRLVKTFEGNTDYQLSKVQTNLVYISSFMSLILSVVSAGTSILFDGTLPGIVGVLYLMFTLIACISLLRLFIQQLSLVINNFLKQFGKISISQPTLAKLNKSIR